MTILPKKKTPKERLEDRGGASTSRGHNIHPVVANPPPGPGAAQYALLTEAASTAQNSENLLNAGPSRPQTHRTSGPSSPSGPQYLSHLNRNKKQKVYSDDDENSDGSRDGSQNSGRHNSPLLTLTKPRQGDDDSCNSDDERAGNQGLSMEEWAQKEAAFARLLNEKRGFVIKIMKEDGACLFRAVADQVLGDQEMHDMVRQQCMDYMERNQDYFSQYITEDFQRYISRKRCLNSHGNHVEIQAMSEVYNRRIEVYQYDIDAINVFQGSHPQENAPIRVSYHQKSHYNSVVDPYGATVGVGLGLPNLQPGLAEQRLVSQAVGQSEQDLIEKQMLEDKLRASDWEATDEAIEQQIAQESYLEWLKQHEKERNCDNDDLSGPSTSNSPSKPPLPTGTGPNQKGSPKPADSQDEGHNFNQLNHLPPALFGLNDWDDEDGDLLAQVLAASQAEYLESLKPRDKNS